MPKLAEVDMKHDYKRKMSKDSVLSNKSNQSGNSNNSDYKMTDTNNNTNTNTDPNQSQHTSFQLNWLTTSSTFNSDDEIKKYVYEKPDSISRWTE